MSDYLIKALAFEGQIRAYAVRATDTVGAAQKKHETWSASSAALGRTMVASLLLGATVKGEDKLTVKVQGDGPGGAIVVDSDGNGNVKGYIQNPKVSLPLNGKGKIDVRGAVGAKGILSVTKDLGLKEPFTGQVPLVSGELGEDFAYYMANSEQVPSAVGLSVLVDTDETIKASGGFMIQVMPGATDETLIEVEKRISGIPLVSKLIDKGETPEQILERLLGSENIKILDKLPVQFKCDCSKEKFASAIITLGVKEIDAMIEEDHGAEAVCHFCGNKYYYTEKELEDLKQEIIEG